MPTVQVDRGAIRFVLKGADVMCPGLTSAGGRLEGGMAQETAVAILAEGKEHAVAIGITKMSSDDMSANQQHTHATAYTAHCNATFAPISQCELACRTASLSHCIDA